MKTYNDIYLETRNALRASGIEGYTLEARLLVATAAGKSVAELLRDINLYTTAAIDAEVQELTRRRLAGEPVAYITGAWEFYGLPMKVTPDVLIPRMDTELLVTTAKELLLGRKMDARILDLCCGSGCIACALGHELPATKLVAVDISANALEIARENFASNRLGSRAICIQADATSSPPMSIGQFDMIVSNPPYIASAEIMTLDASVRDYEPLGALDGGEDGLMFYRAIVQHWTQILRPGGWLMFEVGEDQADAVMALMKDAKYTDVTALEDTAGIRRVVVGRI